MSGYSGSDPPLEVGDEMLDAVHDMLMDGADSKNARIEREIIAGNRVKLTQYLHDVCVLFPFMRQHGVFSRDDCDLVSSERTTTNKVDKFIDILLTKGPKAIGHFHESLDDHYPAIYDFLAQLFSNAGIQLPPERQMKEREVGRHDDSYQQDGRRTDPWSTPRKNLSRVGSRTIRKHLELLGQQCVAVNKERDGLQQTLMQREREIATLLSQNERDQKMQTQQLLLVTQKYQELISEVGTWSSGSAENDLLSKRESIQEEYDRLEADYMLLSSELSAASDRISRLLVHIERNEREHALAQDEISHLKDKLSMKEGEIERISRKYDRVKSLPDGSVAVPTNTSNIEELDDQIRALTTENEQLQLKLEAVRSERKAAVTFAEECNGKSHADTLRYQTERDKRIAAEKKLQMLVRLDGHATFPRTPDSAHIANFSNAIRLDSVTVVMPGSEVSGMGISLGVMVRNVADGGIAAQNGVRIGDEITEINHVSITQDRNPLELANRMLTSARTVTLVIARQTSGGPAHTPGGNPFSFATPTSPMVASLESELLRSVQKFQSLPTGMKLYQHQRSTGEISSSTSASAHNTSEERDGSLLSDDSGAGGFPEHSDGEDGLIYSPKVSVSQRRSYCDELDPLVPQRPTLTGFEFGHSILSDDFTQGVRDLEASLPVRPHSAVNSREKRKSQSLGDIRFPENLMTRIDMPTDEPVESNSMRLALLKDGKLSLGLKLIGGRGYGLFVHSNRSKGSGQALVSGDRIIQIGSRDAEHMTYGEATLLLDGFASRNEQCHISVVYDLKGYGKLPSTQTRDNFFVRAKFDHVKKYRGQLTFKKGDIFRITDTLPSAPHEGTWRCEKLDSKGNGKEKGFIPLVPSFGEAAQSSSTLPANLSSHVFPSIGQGLKKRRRESVPVSFAAAFQHYEPLRQVEVLEPRAVVLLGAFESEVQRQLVDGGSHSDVKFAYCRKEPAESLEDTPKERFIEVVATSEGVKKSCDYHVTELSREGFHCVLSVQPSDLPRAVLGSLDPMVLYLCVKTRGTRTRTLHNLAQNIRSRRPGYHDNGPQSHFDRMKEVQKYHMYITGEVELCSDIDEVVRKVRDVVARQQKNCKWEILDY